MKADQKSHLSPLAFPRQLSTKHKAYFDPYPDWFQPDFFRSLL